MGYQHQWWKNTDYPAEQGIFYLEPVLLNVFSGELPPCMSPSNEECNREETSKHMFLSELPDLQVSIGPHFRKLTLQKMDIFFKSSRKKLLWIILLLKIISRSVFCLPWLFISTAPFCIAVHVSLLKIEHFVNIKINISYQSLIFAKTREKK